jgi:hypothetical protein
MNKIKNINKNIIIIILLIIIFILLIIFYLFDKKNIVVQKHLNKINNNTIILHKKYNYFINPKCNTKYINNIIVTENFLNTDFFNYLKSNFNDKNINYNSKNVIFRKGAGYNFFNLHKSNEYNGLLELYYSIEIINFLTNTLKKPIQRTTLSDENSCSLLIYTKKGDYIDWHKDFSNYYGDRYVSLLTLVNENEITGELSENEFYYIYNGKEYKLKMKPNTFVIFKGSEIFHKSTAINNNEKRILLSMTFCDICQEKKNIINFIYEKIKNSIIY